MRRCLVINTMIKLTDSLPIIGSLLTEWGRPNRSRGGSGSRGDSYNDHEIEVNGRTFLLTGTVEATVIDDSDYDRESGYGQRIYLDNFQYNITRVEEVLQDGTTVDVSNDKSVLDLMEESMKEDLERQFEYGQ